MRVECVTCFKFREKHIDFVSTLIIHKAVVDYKMNENNVAIWSHAIYVSALVSCLKGDDCLSRPMSDYFFSCGISFSSSLPVMSVGANMVASFIVVAFAKEVKLADECPYAIIFWLKMLSFLDIANVFVNVVTYAANKQVQHITCNRNTDRYTFSVIFWREVKDYDWNCNPDDQNDSGDERSPVMLTFFLNQRIEICRKGNPDIFINALAIINRLKSWTTLRLIWADSHIWVLIVLWFHVAHWVYE